MRCEVNISLKPQSQKELGTKVEIKNLNSFKAVEKAINYEIKRQTELLNKGEKIIQETRGWDAIKEITYSQRFKEEAQDYRYFPEPDLPPMNIKALFNLEKLKSELPELSWQTKNKLAKHFEVIATETMGISANLELGIIVKHLGYSKFIENTLNLLEKDNELAQLNLVDKAKTLLYNYFRTDILGILEKEKIEWENSKLTPQYYEQIISYLAQDKISSRSAKDLLLEIIKTGINPDQIIKEKGLKKISAYNLLKSTIEEVIKDNPKAVLDFKKGKENVTQFLVGQAMAKLKGAADPKELEKLIREKLTS